MLEEEGKRENIKSYILGFLIFSISAVVSFFVGFKLGKSVAKEEFRREVMKTRDEELEDILQRIFEKAERKAGITEPINPIQRVNIEEIRSANMPETITGGREVKVEKKESEKSVKTEQTQNLVSQEENEVSQEKNEVHQKEKKTPRSEKKNRASLSKRKSRISLREIGGNIWESGGKWTVQVASFRDYKKARLYAQRLKTDYGLPAYVVKASVKGGYVWRVRVGRMKDRRTAEKLRRFLASKGINGIVTF